MPEIAFTKGHGTGNDFVLVADPDGALRLDASTVRSLCDRRFGVGADGLLRAVRVAQDPDATALAAGDADAETVEWFMDYRNADGSIAEMCGNGIRVFVAFLIDRELATLPTGGSIDILTRGGVAGVQRVRGGFAVDLGRWRLDGTDPLVTTRGVAVGRPGLAISVPNPHVVAALADAEELAAADLTAAPQLDPAPIKGANVELVHPEEPLIVDGTGRIAMRVHERGSGETLSCGTGAAAAALAVRYWAGATAPNVWRVTVPGGTLGVRMFPAEDGEHVALSGPAELVYSGTVSVPESVLSPPRATSRTR